MYNALHRQTMLSTARESIKQGVHLGTRLELDHSDIAAVLLEHKACFVTLKIDKRLRGCIGSVKATEALLDNVVYNAHSAAFYDPRFQPVTLPEVEKISIEIAVLSECEKLTCTDEESLLAQLRPGVDGLVLKCGPHSGTFLPSVWNQLESPSDFLRHLKIKAGLADDYWGDDIVIERYTVESIGENRG